MGFLCVDVSYHTIFSLNIAQPLLFLTFTFGYHAFTYT